LINNHGSNNHGSNSNQSSNNWERRWHALLEQWVVIAANSAVRPWSGIVSSHTTEDRPDFDEGCYLCPGVTRANGSVNPNYTGTFAIDNDFPSLALHAPQIANQDSNPLQRRAPATGVCRVLCWSEKHNVTMAQLSADGMRAVVDLWRQEFIDLRDIPDIHQVLIFENKGVETGASNLHPHGQVYGYPFVSDNAQRMRRSQNNYAQQHAGQSMLGDMLSLSDELIVEQSEHWSVIVPFAARFSYETWVIPHRRVADMSELNEAELDDLAGTYQRQAQRYDHFFKRPAPNITLIHNAPCDSSDASVNQHWHFHIAMQPPLRDPEKLKYLAGAEAGTNNIINPLQPEHAAAQLRACSV
jgi:UDPglucose--hexose-1-phosphate uridylyltransferase